MLVTGEYPFAGRNAESTGQKVINNEPDFHGIW